MLNTQGNDFEEAFCSRMRHGLRAVARAESVDRGWIFADAIPTRRSDTDIGLVCDFEHDSRIRRPTARGSV